VTENTREVKDKNYLEIIDNSDMDNIKILGTQNQDIETQGEYKSYTFNTSHKPENLILYFNDGTFKGLPTHYIGISEYLTNGSFLFEFKNYIFLVEGENLRDLALALASGFVSHIVEFNENFEGDKSPNNVKVLSITNITIEKEVDETIEE